MTQLIPKDIDMKKIALSLITLAASLFCVNTAFADCATDVSSDAWRSLSAQMNQEFEAGNYEEALSAGKRLSIMCDRSPIVNYTISQIYLKMGNETESFNYIRRATEFANEYSLPQPVLEKIWLGRAEQELPHKKELAECQSQLEIQKTAFEETFASELTSTSTTLQDAINAKNQEIVNGYRMNMIIGSSIAGAGAALIAVGASLTAVFYGQASDEWDSSFEVKTTKFNDKNKNVFAGYALLGVGIGAGIAGAAMAIYNKVKLDDAREQIESEKTALSFDISPTSISFGMTF